MRGIRKEAAAVATYYSSHFLLGLDFLFRSYKKMSRYLIKKCMALIRLRLVSSFLFYLKLGISSPDGTERLPRYIKIAEVSRRAIQRPSPKMRRDNPDRATCSRPLMEETLLFARSST